MTAPLFETPSVVTLPATEGPTPDGTVLGPSGTAGAAGAPPAEPGAEGETTRVALASVPALPVLSFIAHDDPIGQGNIRHLGKGRPAVHQNAKTLKPWRATVRSAAIAAIGNGLGGYDRAFPLDEPLHVEATFTVKKPTGAPKTRRVWPAKRPDLDHLLRAVLDSLTGVVFVDDARCVEITCAKRYPLEGRNALTFPGVVVRIYRIGEDI